MSITIITVIFPTHIKLVWPDLAWLVSLLHNHLATNTTLQLRHKTETKKLI